MAAPTTAVLVLTGGELADLPKQVREILKLQEALMAKFEGLDQDIDALRAEVAAVAARVETAVAVLTDDTADQAEIENARVEVQDAVAALKAIAPGAPAEPAPAEPAPAEPAPAEPAPAPE